MGFSRLPILSRILTYLFKKKVTVTVFNYTRHTTRFYDGHIDIHFDPPFSFCLQKRELIYRVLYLVRKTLYQGRFVAGCLFKHGRKLVNWVRTTDDKPPFKRTNHILPEDSSEDRQRYDVYTLKYSIVMMKTITRSGYTSRYSVQLEQLRDDIETLWGKNVQQTDKICGSLQGLGFYEKDLFPMGLDIFISASIVREFKERCTDLGIPIYFHMS